MSAAPYRRTPKGCSWEMSHSLWVLWTFCLMPCVGFFIIGRKMRYKPWLIAGALYLVALAIIFSMTDEDGTSQSDGTFESIYYLGSIVHTFIARSKYIQMLTAEEEQTYDDIRQQQADDQRAAAFAQQYNMHAQRQESTRQQGTAQRQTANDSPHNRQQRTNATTTGTGTTAKTGSAVLNINTATKTQLEQLPGVSAVMALQALKYRHAHQGFSSLDEFFEVIKLKPHFIIQLQDQLVCQPAPQSYPGSDGGRTATAGQTTGTSPMGEDNQPSNYGDNSSAPRGRQLDL